MVTVAKKGKNSVWICLDPTDLNKGIKQPHYLMKTIEDIHVVDNLTDAKYFSMLDCNSIQWSQWQRKGKFGADMSGPY